MANFLELLKNKKINQETVKHDPISSIEKAQEIASSIPAYNTNLEIDKSNWFKSENVNNYPFIKEINGETIISPINVIAERVLDKNRLDLHFSKIPSEEVRQKLKDQGFRFNPDTKCWYHKDSTVNRLFAADLFNLPDLLQDPYNDDKKETSLNFETYKKQVSALLEHLEIDSADLQLKAINSLYNEVFKVN